MQPRVAIWGVVLARDHLAQRLEGRLLVHGVVPVRAGQARGRARASPFAQQRFVLTRGTLFLRSITRSSMQQALALALALVLVLAGGSPGVPSVVVYALDDQNDVGDAEITRKGDGGRGELCEESTWSTEESQRCGRMPSVAGRTLQLEQNSSSPPGKAGQSSVFEA